MRHDAERPQTAGLITKSPVPGHWTRLLATMRANDFTRLSLDELRSDAAHILILAPSAEVARACFGQLLGGVAPDTETQAADGFVEIATAEAIVPEDVPARSWIFLPHRQDGWTELETASARVRAMLVKENAARAREQRFTLIEYGVNLWLWAEPPYGGGDPVCHAGELISWESAWALSDNDDGKGSRMPDSPASAAPARPPIYFGLPARLRERRWNG